LDVERDASKRLPIAAGILDQGIALADPEMAAVPAQPLIHQDRGKLTAFASASAITKEEAAPVAGAFSIGHQFEPAFRHAIAAGKIG
jgi:hypothetical protein